MAANKFFVRKKRDRNERAGEGREGGGGESHGKAVSPKLLDGLKSAMQSDATR